MPRLIILSEIGPNTIYDLYKTTFIGRSDECDLVLDNSSVSRRHARLDIDDSDQVSVEDLGSANGVLINGKKVDKAAIAPGDEVRVGRFTVVLARDGEKFYKGRYLAYMQEHGGTAIAEPMSTHALSTSDMMAMVQERKVINGGRLRSASDPNAYWHPEDRKITFGGSGMVPVKALFGQVKEIVGELAWDGEAHVLRALSSSAKVTINGKKAAQQRLSPGDKVRIARSEFVYEVVEE